MKYKFLSVLSLFISFSACSYNVIERYELKGKIKSYDITMVLAVDGSSVTGSYIYNKNNKNISLKGSYSDGVLNLSESYNGQITGKIDAVSSGGHSFDGEWIGSRKYKFNVERSSKKIDEIVSHYNISTSNDLNNAISIDFVFLDNTRQTLNINIIDDDFQVVIEDVNFDGYPDVRISDNKGAANESYFYYLYNKKSNKYEKSDILSSYVVNPTVLYVDRAVTGFSRDGCCNYIVSILKNNKLQKASYDYQRGKGKLEIININGKVVKTIGIDRKVFEADFLEITNSKL
ncbi:XAC2610-related protein [Pragia fontium]|uniref:DUF4595 domain-containing protein n=1 Tax=Pragia fontium DSM 5563 = ATCC 49100 TaxID=1122977 RepID=A0AAJ4WBK6_9GAMM|nr:hypothetical protein [Pragia fontium]SFD05182.1 hypothetical protein SAMN02745723_10785 [Pragia fontium DSM 5563 = ATCC 49100]